MERYSVTEGADVNSHSIFFKVFEKRRVILAVMQDRQNIDEFVLDAVIDDMPAGEAGAVILAFGLSRSAFRRASICAM